MMCPTGFKQAIITILYVVVLPSRFRLTRMATSDHVARVLLDATGPLAELHQRVLEAGCEVDPDWKLGISTNLCSTQAGHHQMISDNVNHTFLFSGAQRLLKICSGFCVWVTWSLRAGESNIISIIRIQKSQFCFKHTVFATSP